MRSASMMGLLCDSEKAEIFSRSQQQVGPFQNSLLVSKKTLHQPRYSIGLVVVQHVSCVLNDGVGQMGYHLQALFEFF
jgi:hypothetical protein